MRKGESYIHQRISIIIRLLKPNHIHIPILQRQAIPVDIPLAHEARLLIPAPIDNVLQSVQFRQAVISVYHQVFFPQFLQLSLSWMLGLRGHLGLDGRRVWAFLLLFDCGWGLGGELDWGVRRFTFSSRASFVSCISSWFFFVIWLLVLTWWTCYFVLRTIDWLLNFVFFFLSSWCDFW